MSEPSPPSPTLEAAEAFLTPIAGPNDGLNVLPLYSKSDTGNLMGRIEATQALDPKNFVLPITKLGTDTTYRGDFPTDEEYNLASNSHKLGAKSSTPSTTQSLNAARKSSANSSQTASSRLTSPLKAKMATLTNPERHSWPPSPPAMPR